MAACKITVTGTSGIIRIDYTVSGTPYSIETSIGEFYIEDTATDVTYTTLSGDLIATDDSCLGTPIAELPANCYLILWKNLQATNYKIDAIVLGSEIITIPDTTFPESFSLLADAVNNLNDSRVKVTGYKMEYVSFGVSNNYYIFKVLGTNAPILRIKNTDETGYIYIYGESTSCTLPSGYRAVEPCYSTTLTTTTTLAP